MRDDAELLRQYVHTGSQDAFTELVHRHLPVVYASALRQAGGDEELAKDICQTVFIDLGKKAHSLLGHELLIAWLFTATRFTAAAMLRADRRRQIRESIAVSMRETTAQPNVEHPELAPVLDAAMGDLAPEDRNALLLRFFQDRPLKDVAAALRITEDAARMRVNRALDKLHGLLKERGATLSAAALGTALATEAVTAAPAGLATAIVGPALAGATTSGTALSAFKVMAVTKLKVGILGVFVAAGLAAPLMFQHRSLVRLRGEIQVLQQQHGQMAQLEEENDRLSNLLMRANTAQAVSQDELRELLRLRGEVGLLRQQSNELAQLRAENRQLRVPVVAVQQQTKPALAPDDVAREVCISNLEEIDRAIQQYALENHLTMNDIVTAEQISPYLKEPKDVLRCPSGGTYAFGAITNTPSCSVPGHAIPTGTFFLGAATINGTNVSATNVTVGVRTREASK